ncbi:unnamed protein product [Durusdinium trenchii]|uniref:Uncharacterized protein n=3 Tax=Durusdinium trenchii TaxID=1381693 RepID=A0ABP0RZ62_9DINO
MKATLKKPAASSQKDTPRKRPAANLDEAQPKGQPKTKVVKTNEWAKGSKLIPPEEEDADEEEAEEECLESDPIQDEEPFEFDDKRKDRSKDNKFKLLLAQGTLPDWIKEAWEKTKSMRTGRSAAQRKIVNEALTRSPEGALELTLDKPSLQHLKESFTTRTATSKNKSLPKVLFCGKFGLTESAFQEGLERGDFFEVESADGRMTYGWQQDEQATTRGTSSKMEVAASKKLSKEELQVENIAMSSWQFGLFKKKNVKALEGGETPMAIEDQKAELSERAWNAAQKQLLDAQKAMDEQIRAGKKLLQLVGVDNKADPLKDIIQMLTEEKSRLEHMYNWKETPESDVLTLQAYDECMAKGGQVASKAHEQLAGIKGQLSVRAKKVT